MATDSTRLRCLRLALPLVCCGWLSAVAIPCGARDPATITVEEQPINLVMFHDPQLEVVPAKMAFPPGLQQLWLKAMQRPDSELQRLAADSFALAHERGLRDLDRTHAPLADLLRASDQDAAVQRAAVHALIQLDARGSAEVLAETAKSQGLTMSLLVEPALARWKSDLMQDEWLKRIDDPRASHAARILAINGLGETAAADAVNSLKRITNDLAAHTQERMAAARALSKMHAPELVAMATKLTQTPSQPVLLNSVMALELLRAEDSPEAIALLAKLASHVSTAVQSGALQRLYAIDPKHVYEFAEAAIGSRDVGVRTVGARTLIVQKEQKWIAPLATLLDDVNPTLRREVSKALVQLAKANDLHEEVIQQATTVLNRDAWRGIEQAAVVLVLLDYKPSGDRLVELLEHGRGEVKIASAWGLRRLALPEHLPAMLAKARNTHDEFLKGVQPLDVPGSELQTTQLFMAFGQMRYMPAEPLLRIYVPKDHALGTFSRAAAVWSVGLLNEGKAPAELTATLLGRLNDVMSMDPEAEVVRRMSAISIGRMKTQSAVAAIRSRAENDGSYVKRACLWTLQQLTGEVPPPPEQLQVSFSDWFLSPVQ